jgi:DNA-directed RNA polymerase subunit RPC12/RpoP
MLIRLIAQALIFLSISIVIGFLLAHVGISIWLGIVTGAIIQLLIHNTFVTILDSYITIKNKRLENERIKEFSYQGLEVTCPCSKKQLDFIPVRLNTQNSYRCSGCDKSVSVFINAETAMQTEPILSVDTTLAIEPILKNLQNGNP